jgi:hypothetical protein
MKLILLLLLSFPAFAQVELINVNLTTKEFYKVERAVNSINKAFRNYEFVKKIYKIDSKLPHLTRQPVTLNIRREVIGSDKIAQFDGDITIAVDMIDQMTAFHASTICHEIAHYWGYEHNTYDYYDSVPVAFGDACRVYFMNTERDWR